MDESPLIKLPAELRNAIYELVLHDNYCSLLRRKNGRVCHTRRLPALLATCRQIRHESESIFFARDFSIDTRLYSYNKPDPFDSPQQLTAAVSLAFVQLREWLDQIGEKNVSHITSLTIRLGSLPSNVAVGFAEQWEIIHKNLLAPSKGTGLQTVEVQFNTGEREPRIPDGPLSPTQELYYHVSISDRETAIKDLQNHMRREDITCGHGSSPEDNDLKHSMICDLVLDPARW